MKKIFYMFSFVMILSLAFQNISYSAPTDSEMANLRSIFSTSIRPYTYWPVEGTDTNDMSSAFGPRIQYTTGLVDFHRAIDINATKGTPVFNVFNGFLFSIENYTSGGLTVIIKHTLPISARYNEKTIKYFYTYYMHLSSIPNEIQNAAKGTYIPAGSVIGYVGHSGTTTDHLNLELRMGTPYSLEWQTANKTSSYNMGFDPHINPMILYRDVKDNFTLAKSANSNADLVINISTARDYLVLNRVDFRIYDLKGNVVSKQILDYDMRIGYDATSTSKLDTINKSKMYISPICFRSTSSIFETNIVIPAATISAYPSGSYTYQINIQNIYGTWWSTYWK
jgi:murein DD-endopeptidase MepM/ murein hydrolase activator NlpD